MKSFLVRIAVIITVISLLSIVFTFVASALIGRSIDYSLDESLFEKAKEDQTVYYYAYDENDDLTEIYKSSRDTVKEWADIDEVSPYVKQAFIAMEDREYYEHNGVNLKRTAAAAINHIFKFKSSFGASTITQQVIKNISGDNESSVSRKAKEIFRALRLERKYSKDDILELYINIVPMTGNIYGVSAAAEIYFGKSVADLSLTESATIVGITNAPAKYNPYFKAEECKEKRNRVLYAMHTVGYISDSEYEMAISEPLFLSEGSDNYGISSWFIETANDDIISDIVEQYNVSRSAARLMMKGSRVILTVNTEVQEILEKYFTDTDNLSQKFFDGLNYSMVVSDPYTGDLLGIIGNGGAKNADRLFNYATSNVIPGSVLKPIALYAPLIDKNAISWATMIDDSPTDFFESEGESIPYPRNSPDIYDGMIDIKDALRKSKNTVAVRLLDMLGTQNVFNHLYRDYGFSTLATGANGETVSDIGTAPLALGQLSYGISVRRLTEAYNVFPSEGILSKGRSYIRVYDRKGDVILENTPSHTRIYSAETAQVMNQLLSCVVADGTARQIRLKELIDTAGKTGTSGNDRDRLFVGFTPYFTAGIWCGYGSSGKPVGQNTPSHLKIWDEVMGEIHEKLVFSACSEPRGFSTNLLTLVPYCPRSGKLPTQWCEIDDEFTPRLGYFKQGTLPTQECEYHKHCLQSEENVL